MRTFLMRGFKLLPLMCWMLCACSSSALAQQTKAFLHRATAENTAGSYTIIDDPFVNARPDTILIVTPNWNPGGGGSGVYNNSPITVFYNNTTARWAIFNLDMRVVVRVGAAFNVKAYRPASTVRTLVQRTTASNVFANYTFLDPPLSPVPKALLVTSNWNPGGGAGVFNNHPVGVFFDRVAGSPAGLWRVANQDPASPMPIGAAFNVAAEGVGHQATRASIRGNSTYIDNWQVPNDPDLLLFVTPNPYPTWGPGVYNNHPLGVWYDASVGKWAIFNQDMASMPVGVSFTIRAETDRSDRIAFSSSRDGNLEIYVMRTDGTRQRRLTFFPLNDGNATLSPDGSKIAFIHDLNQSRGRNGIWVVNTDGTGLVNLTDHIRASVFFCKPSWSPDGRRIVTLAYGPDSPPASPEMAFTYGIHVINVDGSGMRQLTGRTTETAYPPVFNPDGSKIAFFSFYPHRIRNFEIHVMNSDGTGDINLTNSVDVGEFDPAWSPDGRLIVFSAYPRYMHSEIYVMNNDGTGVRQLTNGSPLVRSRLPVFSPDGSKIAFLSFRSDPILPTTTAELYLMNADGTDAVRLASDVVSDSTSTSPATGRPAFSPDGSKLAFVSNRDGNHEVYTVNIDGTGLTNLTRHPAADEEPTWGR